MKPDTSIINGTHRPQDLIPAFLDALQTAAPAVYEGYMIAPFGPVPAYAQEDHDSEWWDSEDAQGLIAELIEHLNDHAPDDCYFGSHPGDGSDYGFWTNEDDGQ